MFFFAQMDLVLPFPCRRCPDLTSELFDSRDSVGFHQSNQSHIDSKDGGKENHKEPSCGLAGVGDTDEEDEEAEENGLVNLPVLLRLEHIQHELEVQLHLTVSAEAANHHFASIFSTSLLFFHSDSPKSALHEAKSFSGGLQPALGARPQWG